MAKKNATQEDLEALVNEVGRLEGIVLQQTQVNRALVMGLNNAWAVLDRLTGRAPDLIEPSHEHTWTVYTDASFDYHGVTRGEGVTERCETCGAVRSRVTCWQAAEWLFA